MSAVTCIACGHVYVGITLEAACREVESLNKFYDNASVAVRECYSGQSNLDRYRGCSCGSDRWRKSKPDDCPEGVTLTSVIVDGMNLTS